MPRITPILALFCIATCACVSQSQKTEKTSSNSLPEPSLIGDWTVTGITVQGEIREPAEGMPQTIAISADQFNAFSNGQKMAFFAYTYTVNSEIKPYEIDFTRINPRTGVTESLPCIYQFGTEGLDLAMPLIPSPRGNEPIQRPISFDTTSTPLLVIHAVRTETPRTP